MSDDSTLLAYNEGDSTDNPLIHQLEFIVQGDDPGDDKDVFKVWPCITSHTWYDLINTYYT